MHNQVANGGFDQYFINGYGKFALSTVYALNKILAFNKADTVQQAVDLLSEYLAESESDFVLIPNERLKFILDLPDVVIRLDRLTDVYNYETEEISELLNKYLSDNLNK